MEKSDKTPKKLYYFPKNKVRELHVIYAKAQETMATVSIYDLWDFIEKAIPEADLENTSNWVLKTHNIMKPYIIQKKKEV